MFVEVDKNHDHNMTLAEFNGDLPTSQETSCAARLCFVKHYFMLSIYDIWYVSVIYLILS